MFRTVFFSIFSLSLPTSILARKAAPLRNALKSAAKIASSSGAVLRGSNLVKTAGVISPRLFSARSSSEIPPLVSENFRGISSLGSVLVEKGKFPGKREFSTDSTNSRKSLAGAAATKDAESKATEQHESAKARTTARKELKMLITKVQNQIEVDGKGKYPSGKYDEFELWGAFSKSLDSDGNQVITADEFVNMFRFQFIGLLSVIEVQCYATPLENTVDIATLRKLIEEAGFGKGIHYGEFLEVFGQPDTAISKEQAKIEEKVLLEESDDNYKLSWKKDKKDKKTITKVDKSKEQTFQDPDACPSALSAMYGTSVTANFDFYSREPRSTHKKFDRVLTRVGIPATIQKIMAEGGSLDKKKFKGQLEFNLFNKQSARDIRKVGRNLVVKSVLLSADGDESNGLDFSEADSVIKELARKRAVLKLDAGGDKDDDDKKNESDSLIIKMLDKSVSFIYYIYYRFAFHFNKLHSSDDRVDRTLYYMLLDKLDLALMFLDENRDAEISKLEFKQLIFRSGVHMEFSATKKQGETRHLDEQEMSEVVDMVWEGMGLKDDELISHRKMFEVLSQW